MIKVMLMVQEHIHLTLILDKLKFMTYVKKLQDLVLLMAYNCGGVYPCGV